MMERLDSKDTGRRDSTQSNETIRAISSGNLPSERAASQVATLWVHDDNFSKEDVLIDEHLFDNHIIEVSDLIELVAFTTTSDIHDFQEDSDDHPKAAHSKWDDSENDTPKNCDSTYQEVNTNSHAESSLTLDPSSRYLFEARLVPVDLKAKHPSLQVSITSSIANVFNLRNRSQVRVSFADREACTASHVEIGFRDSYLSRSDMWRLASTELLGKTVYKGQKLSFLGTVKATVKAVFANGQKTPTALVSETTIPVFRSEAARYVIYIQMSKEMWNYDSEGNGEILFSRVVNGFLPDLFKRWSGLEVKHLVSIVMFGRLEYVRSDRSITGAVDRNDDNSWLSASSSIKYNDFYRVVVTDMASAQWTKILNELKKDFRVFLRDICLHPPNQNVAEEKKITESHQKIRGQPSTALKGNILEAINMASIRFAHDYIDRDLVRTGVSVVVITPGSGVFDVDRDLLNLTSENLTNNGIGIDIVCLSKMPLHSVPLFRYRGRRIQPGNPDMAPSSSPETSRFLRSLSSSLQSHDFVDASVPASIYGSTPQSMRPFAESMNLATSERYLYGVPQWIDLSYWTSESRNQSVDRNDYGQGSKKTYGRAHNFVPRVRMYELQMMGVMELGLANISIPYMSESMQKHEKQSGNKRWPGGKNSSTSPHKLASSPDMKRRREGKAKAGLLSAQSREHGDFFKLMDSYDNELYTGDSKKPAKKSRVGQRQQHSQKSSAAAVVKAPENSSIKPTEASLKGSLDIFTNINNRKETPTKQQSSNASIKSASLQVNATPSIRSSKASRTISFAFKGFAPLPRAVASTSINVENAEAQPPIKRPESSDGSSAATGIGHSLTLNALATDQISISDRSDVEYAETNDTPSKPISIQKPELIAVQALQARKQRKNLLVTSERDTDGIESDSVADGVQRSKAKNERSSGDESELSEASSEGSLPSDELPWIRSINASNPTKNNPKAASWFGRWQHLYPSRPKASVVKWKSLCTPASVPLTTEDFPTADELETLYEKSTYAISKSDTHELLEVPKDVDGLLREMLSLRLAHGYQIVTGPAFSNSVKADLGYSPSFFIPGKLSQEKNPIFMSMGNTIQKLFPVGAIGVQVTRYIRKPNRESADSATSIAYSPNIRTILSPSYMPRRMKLVGFAEQYPWQLADTYLADPKTEIKNPIETLRFWRARFVLIPVEPPAKAWKLQQSEVEENEEEIHLLGIRALTQMWQKSRYIPAENRKFNPKAGRKKDQNPLEINFRTMNPSEVVFTEMDKLLASEDSTDANSAQLLAESDKFERETLDMNKLAETLQGEKGIEIRNRRWHLKLYYNCFHGEELTNWILRNVKNVETRDDAVEFGNDLMQHKLFSHVNDKHNFKDGHYFYSIEPSYRVQKLDSKQSWFPTSRRSDRSVPATPMTDNLSRDSPFAPTRSRSNSLDDSSPVNSADIKPSTEKKRMSVYLSKMIRINVDQRKRSDRPEIINLHYDRLHNPENCYHLELSWFNVTSKLVEDAIVTWAQQAEKYGLRLIEVPIAEAGKISDHEPFREAYRISLALPAPEKTYVGAPLFTATSFAPQAPSSVDKHIYQKALLKRFNFVLDLEAASEFPADVDIHYSWGKLEYHYTQFVHRSGVILAQITEEGDLLLLANRLYSTRSATTKDASVKFDLNRKDPRSSMPPHSVSTAQMQASGILGLNVQNPSPLMSPMVRATAEVFNSKVNLASANFSAYITPERIKDELEVFCHDKHKLEGFYREVTMMTQSQSQQPPKRNGSTSSSVLRPVAEVPDIPGIPELKLPARLVENLPGRAMAIGLGIGFGRKMSPHNGDGRASPKRKGTG